MNDATNEQHDSQSVNAQAANEDRLRAIAAYDRQVKADEAAKVSPTPASAQAANEERHKAIQAENQAKADEAAKVQAAKLEEAKQCIARAEEASKVATDEREASKAAYAAGKLDEAKEHSARADQAARISGDERAKAARLTAPATRSTSLKSKELEPIKHEKVVTLRYAKANGIVTGQSMPVSHHTALDALKYVDLPTDGSRLVLKRDGTPFGLHEKMWDDVLHNEDVHIVKHPDAKK